MWLSSGTKRSIVPFSSYNSEPKSANTGEKWLLFRKEEVGRLPTGRAEKAAPSPDDGTLKSLPHSLRQLLEGKEETLEPVSVRVGGGDGDGGEDGGDGEVPEDTEREQVLLRLSPIKLH